MRIAIIGGGIGGLTVALALRQFGFEPRVFEQAPELLEVGAAILMWPNAMRILSRLGLADAVREHGGALEEAIWLHQDGRLLNQFRLPETDVPAVALHRADLQGILLSALPPESIFLDHVFLGFEEQPDALVARFSDRPSVECDVLIGADGLHSRARAQLLNDGSPTDRGYIAWRGVVPYAPQSLRPASAIEIYGAGQRFGMGPLGSGRIGWWASVNQSASTVTNSQTVAEGGNKHEELLPLFDGWCKPVIELIKATPLTSLVRNRTFDRSPVRNWGAGSVILLGDAVHPMTPNLGQGGCLAIEDAAVLARCLKEYVSDTSPKERLARLSSARRRFEALRFTRTVTVARFSRMYGVVGQWENQLAVRLRSTILRTVPTQVVQRLLRWIFDYDAYGVTI